MSSMTEESKNSVAPSCKAMPVARRDYKAGACFFQNSIRSQGGCGPRCDRSGFKQYLINNDHQHSYRVSVVSSWRNSRTGAQESHTKIFISEAGGEIYLGCNYQHMALNGDTRITRKITREVKIEN
jgi:hypothetical protein